MSFDLDELCLFSSTTLKEQLATQSLEIGVEARIDDEYLDYLLLEHVLLEFKNESQILFSIAVLSRCGVDVNARSLRDATTMSLAIERHWYNACLTIIALGGDVNYKDNEGGTAILFAVEQIAGRRNDLGALSLVRCIATESAPAIRNEHGLSSGLTPLGVATHAVDDVVVKLLLDSGCDVNSRDLDGCTPLDVLTRRADSSEQSGLVEELLLSYGGERRR